MEAAYVRLRDKAHSIAIARTGLRKNFVTGVLARAGGAEIEERGGIYVVRPSPVRHARGTTRTTARQINVDQVKKTERSMSMSMSIIHYRTTSDSEASAPRAPASNLDSIRVYA